MTLRVCPTLQIADFGLSNLYHQGKFLQTFCGSPLYASPEIVNGKPYTGPEVGVCPPPFPVTLAPQSIQSNTVCPPTHKVVTCQVSSQQWPNWNENLNLDPQSSSVLLTFLVSITFPSTQTATPSCPGRMASPLLSCLWLPLPRRGD